MSWITLQDNSWFAFTTHNTAGFNSTGSYEIKGKKLILYVTVEEKYIFKISDRQLTFESKGMAPYLVEIGTVFKLKEEVESAEFETNAGDIAAYQKITGEQADGKFDRIHLA